MKALRVWILALVALCVGCPAGTSAPLGRPDAGPVSVPRAAPSAEPVTEEEALTRGMPSALPVAAPPPKETRTAAQLAQAACTGPGGKWLCSRVKPPPQVMALGSSPIIPFPWTIPLWVVDPANLSGNASDGNPCISTAAPCLTWHEVNDHRWGCLGNPVACPRLQQTTSVEFFSSQADNTDPVYFLPAIETGAVVQLFGPLGASQQIASTTLSNVTAKARATPQLLLAQSGATATKQLVVNSTHSSRAWTYLLSSGSIYKMTQPETPAVVPSSQFACASEVDTWANGDAVVVYQPVKVNITLTNPVVEGFNGGSNNAPIFIYNLAVTDFAAVSNIASLNGSVLWESSISRQLSSGPAQSPQAMTHCNSFMATNVSSLMPQVGGGTPPLFFKAGAMIGNNSLSNVGFFDDVILAGQTSVGSASQGGSGAGAFGAVGIYVETAKTLAIGCQFNGTSTIFWGPGTLNVAGSGRLTYTANAATNLLIAALRLNGSATAHSVNTTANVDTACGGINLTATNLDTAVSATCATTGFGGLAYNPGGASITTGGL